MQALLNHDLRMAVLSEKWSLKAAGCSIQVVSNTGLTVLALKPV